MGSDSESMLLPLEKNKQCIPKSLFFFFFSVGCQNRISADEKFYVIWLLMKVWQVFLKNTQQSLALGDLCFL